MLVITSLDNLKERLGKVILIIRIVEVFKGAVKISLNQPSTAGFALRRGHWLQVRARRSAAKAAIGWSVFAPLGDAKCPNASDLLEECSPPVGRTKISMRYMLT